MDSFDISRVGFDPLKHYSGVRMQQGRVVTDDDYNEDNRIDAEQARRETVDIIGSTGSPDNGFRIKNLRHADGLVDFDISPGSIYVGGLRFEMEAHVSRIRYLRDREINKELHKVRSETYRTQRDWLQQPTGSDPEPKMTGSLERYDLVYLEGWQQAVSAIEDSELLEAALGGPDTGVRIRNMRRVRIHTDIGEADCATAWQKQIHQWKDKHMGSLNQENELVRDVELKVSFLADPNTDNLCAPSVAGGYLGAENQAIRVQLTGKDHFTWGFDNASPLYRVTVGGDTVTFLTALKDQHHWPLAGQVIEILPWSAVLPNGEKIAEITGFLSKVSASYNPDTGEIKMAGSLPATFGNDWKNRPDSNELSNQEPPEYFYLRIWNRGTDLSTAEAIHFVPGTPVPLGNTGLAVTITGHELVSGDFWVIAARPNTPDQVVPWKLEVNASPVGVRRFYTPLAILQWHDYGEKIVGHVLHDCRRSFRPLTDQKICCTYTVGDKIHSRGDFNSIEEAVDNLPPDGGRICVLPGDHYANLQVFQKSNIHITGCGDRSVVRPHPKRVTEPVFHFDACQKIELSNMSVIAIEGTAIHIVDRLNVPVASSGILIRENQVLAFKHAITVRVKEDMPGDNDIRILDNRIGMIDREGGLPAIFCIGDDVLIERNRIVVVSPPEPENPQDPRKPGDPGYTLYNPCREPKSFYETGFRINRFVSGLFLYINGLTFPGYRIMYKALGGIQVGSTSERFRVIDNDIIGGAGNGITLGHLPQDVVEEETAAKRTANEKKLWERRLTNLTNGVSESENFVANFRSTLYDIAIERNRIRHMGLSGISVVTFFDSERVPLMISLSDVTIFRNSIISCAQQIPEEIPAKMRQEVAYGGIILASCDICSIRENRVENNGISQAEPVCGIYIMMGDRIEIAGNHILNNGPRLEDPKLAVRQGIRGGIVVRMSLKKYQNFSAKNLDLSAFDGMPALMVQGNIVTQPLGHALLLVALGPVSITGNVFTSQGIDKTNPFSLLAGSVFILDLGISKDFLVEAALKFSEVAKINKISPDDPGYKKVVALMARMQFIPSGAVMFSDNQTSLDLRDKTIDVSLSSQLIASLDDIAYNGNQSECLSYLSLAERAIDVVLVNTALVAITVRSNNNRFQEGTTLTKWSLFSLGFANMAIGNHASHCLHVLGANTPPADVLTFTNYVLLDTRCNGARELLRQKFTYGEMNNNANAGDTKAGMTEGINMEQDMSHLDTSFDQLETQRADGLVFAREMTTIRNKTLVVEAERLGNKYGQNHVQITKIDNQISFNKEYIKNIDIEIKRRPG